MKNKERIEYRGVTITWDGGRKRYRFNYRTGGRSTIYRAPSIKQAKRDIDALIERDAIIEARKG